MNLDSLTAALSHIGNLIVNLTKKTLNTSVQEVKELIDLFGGEAEQHLYRAVLSQLEWSSSSSDLKSIISINGNSSNTSISNSTVISTTTKEKELGTSTGSTCLTFTSTNGATLVLLIQQLILFVPLQRFATCFAVAISTPLNTTKTIRQGWVSGIFKLFKLTKVQEVVICLQLLHSLSAEVKNQCISLLKTKLPELLRSYIEADSGGREISDLSTETLHIILTQAVYSHRDQATPILSSELRLEFLTVLQKEFPRSQAPLVLLPILYPDSDPLLEKLSLDSSNMAKTNLLYGSLADFVLEMGYSFCSSLEECRGNLASFGTSNITPLATAKVLGAMVKTQSGLQSEQMGVQNLNDPNSLWSESKDKNIPTGRIQSTNNDQSTLSSCSNNLSTWNMEIFIKSLLEVVPNINTKEVIMKLDYKGFYVKDKQGLKLLFVALRFLLQGQGIRPEHFPVECLYRQWKNSEEQLYFLEQILNNPDVFCFADFPCHLVTIEGLKALPEVDNKMIATWKSLELIELLLCLAEGGHAPFVKELLKFPISHCPDILVLGLLQVNFNVPFSLLRQELIASILPLFLGSHLNSASVLHHVWHNPKDTSTVRQIMVHAMAEWYLMSDNSEAQQRLSRILDVAQDLKALSLLLNAKPFMFVIDLACLAYRREYLKLDKWLSDKIRENGEQFITACVKFLPRRCPQLVGGKEDLLPKSAQLPSETVSTMLACLQSCQTGLSQELSETIITMAQNCSLLNRPRQMSLSSSLKFPGQNDALGGITSNLGSLTLGSSTSSSIFPPPVSSSIGLGALGLGVGAPSSPARPSLPPAPVVQSSQASITSMIPSLQLSGPPLAAVGSQLQSSNNILSSSPLSGALRSQSTQPIIAPPRQTVDISQIFEIPPVISKEVEDEANSYFQRIYNHPPHPTLTIEEVLEMLKKFHESSNKREQEVYSCMLKNLFEEYRFFPTYPNRELILTAKLFGGIIEQGLVEYIALGVALRYVVEALQKPHDSKMYYFGIVALDKFKSRLKEYPRYCHHLMAIEHFNEFPPHLIEYIKYGTQSQEPLNRPSGTVLPPSMSASLTTPVVVSSAIITPPVSAISVIKSLTATTTTTTSSIVARPQNLAAGTPVKPSMATTNIETLLVATEKEEKLSSPPDHIQDKIAFIFNNLSQLNLPQKCEELKDTLTEEYWPWLSQYLVMKRASIENNFHTLYSLFLDQLNIPTINNIVLQETLRNVKVLLQADKSSANFSDKSLLKNLGHWLGMLTLAKNQPILHIDVDVKSLLIEAYRRGLQELQYVVPFVAKILESCAKSRVFKAPNPWTMAIMNVLAELHREPDMKLHLKFEIEVLCNKLELNVKDLKSGNILKNPEKLAKLKAQLSQPGGKRAESTPLFSTIPGEGEMSTQSSSAGATPTPPAVLPTQSSSTPTHVQALPTTASEPRFVYDEISLSSLRCFDAHITISNPQVGNNLETNAQLKQLVRHAVELAVQELITAVMERSIKVANTTTEHIIKKDFALEPDETRMRAATHHIVRNLTAAMAMITSKDALTTTIAKGIKQGILAGFNRQQTNPQQMEQVDQLANSIAAENTGIACAFIQKTAAEKAVLEMDKRFAAEYEARKLARSEGRRYCDTRVLTYQAERMPEQIRLKVGRVTQQQTAVYEEFARNIPGFVPVVEEDTMHISKPIPLSSSFNSEEGAFFLFTERITQELEPTIQAFNQLHPSSHLIPMLHSLLEGILLCRTSRDVAAAQLLVKRAVENLMEGIQDLPAEAELNQMIVRFRDVHLFVLKAMADPRAYGAVWTSKLVSNCWIESREEIRFRNLDVIDWLLRSNLIHIPMLDDHLARVLEEPRNNFIPLLFIMQIVQVYLIDESTANVLSEQDLQLTLEGLVRLCQTRQAPDGLINLIETLRMKHRDLLSNNDRLSTGTGANALTSGLGNSISRGVNNMHATTSHHFHSGVTQARDFSDPPGLNEKTDALLRQWIQMYHAPNAGQGSAAAFQHFVKEMDLHGILKTDEVITRFFRICITMCRDLCIRTILEAGNSSSPTYVRNKCFPNLDAFVRLIALLVKQSGEPSNPTAKINLLNKVLGLVCGILLHDIESHGNEFHQLPYHRILIMLFLELNAPETVLESINLPVLMAFTQTLHLLRPAKCPGFAYAWLEMVSHRVFIGRMLAITPQQKGWSMYSMLLTDLFKFLAPFLRNVELSKPFTMLYKGTLRVLLVLLHDFPEFLCEYHYTFCDVIPPNCIQMRNLILSAYPRNMRLPDPFMPNLKVDRLQEISVSPKIHSDVGALIQPELKKNLDSYLKNRNPVTFLSELRSYLQVSNEPGNCYNTSVMNALVLYVGMQAIAQIQSKGLTPSMPTIAHSAHMDIFENLAVDLDTEGRYLFLIAIANQLRYPNSHTHYFSCTLLYLFSEANTEAIQEQITRVLLERLIGNRPQPWGLLITFIELIKNPTFKFWSHEFVKCAPEIEKIFESVARSCMVSKGPQSERE